MSYFDYQAARASLPAKAAPMPIYRTVRSEYQAYQALRAMVRQ